ncbi:MAG: lytic transglycosylase [endosymbiont of Escarpia spicata]|uniref:Lytic transglycosylase n=1 Tax=endosymbiont of Escarpia spicata TaxID=2200908 RepID=A0A370DMV2_9GAMM|nr:MAG: lytic transglycosylase [endosymbiont of Escarpia spicata]
MTAGRSLLIFCLLVSSSPLMAQIFKYRAPDGHIHFTDHPMAGNYRLLWKSAPAASAYGDYSVAAFKQNKSKLSPLIDATAKNMRLHPGLLHSVVRAESAYNPRAVSKVGAQGLMQLMPKTARRYGVNDSFNPRQNLEGGARYLKDLLQQFGFDLKLALAAYNAGEGAVKKFDNQIPPYPETQQYVKKVMGYYRTHLQGSAN